MAQDILITPKASTPTIAYTGNGGGAATITQKILSTSIMQFDDGGAILLEMDPVANTVSALNLETNALTIAGTAAATTFQGSFSGDGSNLTGVVAEWDGSHTGNATITGSLDITNGLDVTGNTVLDAVTGTGLTVQGNAAVTGTLNVTGNTTLAAVTGTNANFDAITGDSLSVTGNVSANAFYGDGSNLTNIAATAIDHGALAGLSDDDHTQYIFNAPTAGTRNVITAGAAFQALTLKAAAVPVANSPMFVIEANNGTDKFVVDIDGDVTGAAATFNSAAVTGTLNVTGNSTLGAVTSTGTFRVNGAAQVTGTLNVTGNTTLAAVTGTNMRANGTLTVTGSTTLAAVTATNTQVNGTLTVTGNTTLAAVTGTGLQVNGNAAVTGTLNVTGNTTLAAVTGSTLTVTGNSVLEDVTGTGAFNLSGNMLGAGDIQIAGDLKAASKSFLIDHPDPAKTGWKLQYTCLEGPENGVYTRGRSNSCCIELPDYWPNLVHEDSLSVQITPVGLGQMTLKVAEIRDNKVFVQAGNLDDPIDFFYIVHATRKDIPMLVVEHEPVEEGK
jgi:cytoskeletal protein CcmA (bactofilin family)